MRPVGIGVTFVIALVVAFGAVATARADNPRTVRLVSIGSNGENGTGLAEFFGATPDGRRIFFRTPSRLSPEDTDNESDVYERIDGTTTRLVSIGPVGGNGPEYAIFVGVSDDGSRVVFRSRERLTTDDTDTRFDLYERAGGTTRLLTRGPVGGNAEIDADPPGSGTYVPSTVSAEGRHVFFLTAERLTTDDTDSGSGVNVDVYENVDGVVRLVSTGPTAGPATPSYASFQAASEDGRHVFFKTRDPLVPEDTNANLPCLGEDIYERVDGALTRLVSTGSGYSNLTCVDFHGTSADGHRAYFDSNSRLTDEGGGAGAYVRTDGTSTTWLAPAYRFWFSPDGAHIFFVVGENLVPEDTDSCETFSGVCDDVYERFAGQTRLVSTGPLDASGPFGAFYWGSSADGAHVIFNTGERMTPDDFDAGPDIYDRAGGTTALISTGPSDDGTRHEPHFDGVSEDGRRVFFWTDQQLVPQDTNGTWDAYERFDGSTTQLGTTPDGSGAPSSTFTWGISPDGRRVYLVSLSRLAPQDTDDNTDVYVSIANHVPQCGAVSADPNSLNTPNHKLVTVRVAGVTDADGDAVEIEVTGVTQDEPVNGSGDGDTAPDAAAGARPGEVQLRAERSATGDGRVYKVAFRATDSFGGSCTGQATITVPKSGPATDSAPPEYDSFS
jgi:hypothetical protein